MAFRTKCSSKTTQKCQSIRNRSKKIRVIGAIIAEMEEKQLEDHCDEVAKAHIDNFESGLFPPDLLLPKRPGRTIHPQIYNSW